MTDNNAAKPAETRCRREEGSDRSASGSRIIPNIWEFILFNVLSNISTITRFVVTWIGTAIFITRPGPHAAVPLPDLQLRHQGQRSGRIPHLPALPRCLRRW